MSGGGKCRGACCSNVANQPRRRQRLNSLMKRFIAQPDVALLSQWRSPTEFLLHTPGDQLLKTVPRLGGSLIEIKALAPEQKNELEEQ